MYILQNNISNPSAPGFQAMKLQDHLHSTDFENEFFPQKKYNPFYKKNVDAEKKTNGNNVDSQKQMRRLTSNENMIGYCQITM